ncbi:MAG: hypothetical protein V8T87_12470 [Victivallales bacterium]
MIEKGLVNALAVSIPLHADELELLHDTGAPLVNINRRTKNRFPYVMENPRKGAELLYEAFLKTGAAAPVLLAPVEIPENVILGTDVIHLLTDLLNGEASAGKGFPFSACRMRNFFPERESDIWRRRLRNIRKRTASLPWGMF